nr:B27 [uncultured bacterium]
MMNDLAADLRRSPDLLPHSLDPLANAVYLAAMTPDAYREASFLDQRILTQGHRGKWLRWPDVAAAAADLPVGCGLIFHIGHVGSTLLSRLVGDCPGFFSLREPAALRTLAELFADRSAPDCPWPADRIETATDRLLALWSRVYAPGDRAIIKATSFASELAADTLARHPQMPALAMTLPAEAYLAVILAGDASRAEIRAMSRQRLRRLHARLGDTPFRLYAMSEGEIVAMTWLTETMSLSAAGSRVRWLDFESMLADPAAALGAVTAHFGRPAPPDTIAAVLAGGHMTRYSKSQDHGYSADLRRDVMNEARDRHADEIRKGLAWLDAAARTFQMAAAAMATAKGETADVP